jgi:outer membrane protein
MQRSKAGSSPTAKRFVNKVGAALRAVRSCPGTLIARSRPNCGSRVIPWALVLAAVVSLRGIAAAEQPAFDPTVRPLATVQPPAVPSGPALPPMQRRLTLRAAEDYALAHQPRLAASVLRSQAEIQRVYEARSAFFPQLQGDAVGVKAKDDDNRLAAIGGITNPTILTRQSDGLVLSQLITDFGRTYFLTTSARASALSAAQLAQVSRENLLFRVDQAYFTVEGAQSLLQVANQTVATHQLLLDRVRALAVSNLRSSLDVSFEEVNAAQARLLQIQTQARLQEADAELSAALGLGGKIDFVLVPLELGAQPPADVAPLIARAFAQRPDLLAARADRDAAYRFAKAERAARYPTITGQGGYGLTPEHEEGALPPNYGAVGVNVSVPVFTGGNLSAREREAFLRAQAAQKTLEAQETDAARDVYSAWFDARTAFEAIAVTRQLLDSAQQAFQLAQSRYQVGTSSIVELSQADLQQIQAQITAATSRFDYQVRRRALDFQLGALK